MLLDNKIRHFISEEAVRLNLASCVIIPFNKNIMAQEISSLLPSIPDLNWPEYLTKTWKKRTLTDDYLDWAKSAILIAVDSKNIPNHSYGLPVSANFAVSGLVAAYASRKKNYHLYLTEILANFAKQITKISGSETRTEISVDTKPVAEKALACIAGLGKFGKNTCINVPGYGCGTFIGILFTSLDYRVNDFWGPVSFSSRTSDFCSNCNLCLHACPTGALRPGEHGKFQQSLCRCHLNIEKKTDLGELERKLLGEWIFACDLCIASCPGTKIEAPYELDLKWLLLEDDNKIKNIIDATPMKYPGLKKLRKNAVAVLQNKGMPDSLKLLDAFERKIRDSFSS